MEAQRGADRPDRVRARRGGGPAGETTARALRVTPSADWAGAAIEAVRQISGEIGIKRPLRNLGATRELLPSLATDALADAVTSNAPRKPSHAEALELLESVY